jgi:hypothetical protein
MCFFALSVYFASLIFAKSALEEVIDDELVWQEVKNLPVDAALISKMIAEIEGIKRKTRVGKACEQYVLYARFDGFYPFPQQPGKLIKLNKGEIWKIGKTCSGQTGRYPSSLPAENLLYEPQFKGDATQCLIVEKVKLYAYTFSAENLRRSFPLFLPPGNLIYR